MNNKAYLYETLLPLCNTICTEVRPEKEVDGVMKNLYQYYKCDECIMLLNEICGIYSTIYPEVVERNKAKLKSIDRGEIR